MPDTHPRSRHRGAPAPQTGRLARRGLHALVLAVIAGGTAAFAITPSAAPGAQVSLTAGTADAVENTAVDRAELAASRFEARPPLEAVALEIVVDGKSQQHTTTAATVGDALTQAGIALDNDDVVSVPVATPVSAGMSVEVTTVQTEDRHVTETDSFETIEEEDGNLPRGEREVVTEGVDGLSATTFRVTTAGGEVTGRDLVARAVVSERVDEVVRVGTAEPVVAAPPPSSSSSSSSSSSDASSESSEPSDDVPSYSGGSPKAIGAELAAARGWGGEQFTCLDRLWTRESNWNPTAQNPSSGAYGIPQSLPGTKMATVGSDWRTNPATQITWGLNYIAGRYGTPCGAWSHSQSVGWY